jgi:hypothetical protein
MRLPVQTCRPHHRARGQTALSSRGRTGVRIRMVLCFVLLGYAVVARVVGCRSAYIMYTMSLSVVHV